MTPTIISANCDASDVSGGKWLCQGGPSLRNPANRVQPRATLQCVPKVRICSGQRRLELISHAHLPTCLLCCQRWRAPLLAVLPRHIASSTHQHPCRYIGRTPCRTCCRSAAASKRVDGPSQQHVQKRRPTKSPRRRQHCRRSRKSGSATSATLVRPTKTDGARLVCSLAKLSRW